MMKSRRWQYADTRYSCIHLNGDGMERHASCLGGKDGVIGRLEANNHPCHSFTKYCYRIRSERHRSTLSISTAWMSPLLWWCSRSRVHGEMHTDEPQGLFCIFHKCLRMLKCHTTGVLCTAQRFLTHETTFPMHTRASLVSDVVE